MTTTKGTLLRSLFFNLHCGKCGYNEGIDVAHDYRDAERIAREMGWKKTRLYGWLCFKCAKK